MEKQKSHIQPILLDHWTICVCGTHADGGNKTKLINKYLLIQLNLKSIEVVTTIVGFTTKIKTFSGKTQNSKAKIANKIRTNQKVPSNKPF